MYREGYYYCQSHSHILYSIKGQCNDISGTTNPLKSYPMPLPVCTLYRVGDSGLSNTLDQDRLDRCYSSTGPESSVHVKIVKLSTHNVFYSFY